MDNFSSKNLAQSWGGKILFGTYFQLCVNEVMHGMLVSVRSFRLIVLHCPFGGCTGFGWDGVSFPHGNPLHL